MKITKKCKKEENIYHERRFQYLWLAKLFLVTLIRMLY